MSPNSDTKAGTPDALNPEWDAYATAWAVETSDFASLAEASEFLLRRKRIFSAASQLGIPKEMLTPFAPNKPGFEERVQEAFERLAAVAGLAAE